MQHVPCTLAMRNVYETQSVRGKKRMYLAVLSPPIFAHSLLITTNFTRIASAHTHTHTAVLSALSADIVSVSVGDKTCWATFPDIRNLCARNERREMFSAPPRFALDWHANSPADKTQYFCHIETTRTVCLIFRSILNKTHIHSGNTILHIAHCYMFRPRSIVIKYWVYV